MLLDIVIFLLSLFGHALLFTSVIYGGNTLPQKRINEPSPTEDDKAKMRVLDGGFAAPEKTKITTDEEIISEKTACEEDFAPDVDDKPTVFEKINAAVHPVVDPLPRKKASKPKLERKKISTTKKSGKKKRKDIKQVKRISAAGGGKAEKVNSYDAAASDDKKKKKKKKVERKTLARSAENVYSDDAAASDDKKKKKKKVERKVKSEGISKNKKGKKSKGAKKVTHIMTEDETNIKAIKQNIQHL